MGEGKRGLSEKRVWTIVSYCYSIVYLIYNSRHLCGLCGENVSEGGCWTRWDKMDEFS